MTLPLQNFSIMLAQVTYPALARFSEDHERFRAAYLRTSSLISLATFPVMVGLGITAQPFVRLFLGPKWMPVAALLMVFGPLGALQSLSAVNLIYTTQGRTDLLFRWQIFASICYVASFVVGLRWGIMGVAVSYTTVWTLLMAPMLAIPFRLVGITLKAFVRALWPTTWPTLVMAAITAVWLQGIRRLGMRNSMMELLSTAALGAVVYVGLILWQKPPVLSDLLIAIEGSSNPAARLAARLFAKFVKPPAALTAATADGPTNR
jgi:O-antigen/teichoic acid export membrane protein